MSSVVTAVAGSAVAGIAGSLIGADAAKDAAETQADSADRASQITWDMYEQNRKDMLPTIRAGNRARQRAEEELALGPWTKEQVTKGRRLTPAEKALTKKIENEIKTKKQWVAANEGNEYMDEVNRGIAALQERIGSIRGKTETTRKTVPTGMGTFNYKESQMYKSEKEQGMNAIAKSMNAQGLLGSGALPRTEASYVTNLAGKDYMDAANLWLNTKLNEANIWATTKLNPNLSLAGAGQVATQNLAQMGTNSATNVGQNTMAAGNAMATGRINSANAWTQGLQGVGNALAGMNWGGIATPTPTPTPAPTPAPIPDPYGSIRI